MITMIILYKYTNNQNNKCYVGKTSKTLEERAGKNLEGYKGCKAFYKAIKKHGPNAFTREILESVATEEEARLREQELIEEHQTRVPSGYNIAGVVVGRPTRRRVRLKDPNAIRRRKRSPKIHWAARRF